ncbi:MAG: hypothetical protein KKD21_01875 [Proteobacteria bacterium]|nr:hypothetical protein [Pseudomonadota bacterium]
MNDFLQSLRNGQAEKPRTPKTRKNTDNSYHYTSNPRFHSYGGYQNNRNQGMKRPPAQHQSGNQTPTDEISATSLLAEAIENLSIYVETLAKNQDYLISIQERTADMIERQAIAIERIVDHLNIAPAQETEPRKDNAPEKTFERHNVIFQKPELVVTEPLENIEPVKTIVETVKSRVETIDPKKPVLRKRKKIVVKKAEEMVSTDNKLLSREAVMDIIHSMRAKGDTFDMVASRLVELGQPTFSGRGEWHAQTIHRLCNKR